MGIWVSVPTVDVTTATLESQFLLSPNFKNEQIIMTGSVLIGNMGTATVFFPETLPSPPYIPFWSSESATTLQIPFSRGVDYNGYAINAQILTDRIVFVNGTAGSFWIFYHVLARKLGS